MSIESFDAAERRGVEKSTNVTHTNLRLAPNTTHTCRNPDAYPHVSSIYIQSTCVVRVTTGFENSMNQSMSRFNNLEKLGFVYRQVRPSQITDIETASSSVRYIEKRSSSPNIDVDEDCCFPGGNERHRHIKLKRAVCCACFCTQESLDPTLQNTHRT